MLLSVMLLWIICALLLSEQAINSMKDTLLVEDVGTGNEGIVLLMQARNHTLFILPLGLL